jgi:hypothetical protein
MIKLILDDNTGVELAAAGQCVEICNAAGRTIGFFTPADAPRLDPQISDAELGRREREDETFSTQEIKAFLRKL